MEPRDVHRRAELQTQFEVRLYFCQLHETGSREENRLRARLARRWPLKACPYLPTALHTDHIKDSPAGQSAVREVGLPAEAALPSA
jgi:hypothetical protein